jgi:beta-glucosidase
MEPLWSNYNGLSGELVTVLEGITSKVSAHTAVTYNPGCALTGDTLFRGTWLIGDSEAVVAVMGLNSLIEGEAGDAWLSEHGGDRKEIGLPHNQVKYIRRLAREGKPIIVVVMAGSAVSLSDIEPYADAILYAWYPGEQGGNAVADILFGDVNPAGRLPVTIYRSEDDLPPFDDYTMTGRTYRYFEGEPEYPFGFGLSYTTFEYLEIIPSIQDITADGLISLAVTVKNSGSIDGEELVQVYSTCLEAGCDPRLKALIGFRRVSIPAGETRKVKFEIPVRELEFYSPIQESVIVMPGTYNIVAGGNSSHKAVSTEITVK